MKRILCVLMSLLVMATTFAQNSVTLTFSGQKQDGSYVRLNYVRIANLTRGWSEMITYPDTVFTMEVTVGVPKHQDSEEMSVMPNPFNGSAQVNVTSPRDEQVQVSIFDLQGHRYAYYQGKLSSGDNFFQISLAVPQTYIMTVQSERGSRSLKMINIGHGGSNHISYVGNNYRPWVVQLKSSSTHEFRIGDQLQFLGFATVNNIERQSAVIVQPQYTSELVVLPFVASDAVPCPGMPTVTDHEGNVYNTVQIGGQCWTKENMRCVTSPSTGTYLIASSSALYTNTGKQARWVNHDSATYAPLGYGVLYNWNAAVDTFNTAFGELSIDTTRRHPVWATFSGHRRGICPEGWHVPSDNEWETLENYLSSQEDYLCNHYSIFKAVCSQTGWVANSQSGCDPGNNPETNNASGFSALPAGYYFDSFDQIGHSTGFWSCTRKWTFNPNYLYLSLNSQFFLGSDEDNCYSVRCLRDYFQGNAEFNDAQEGMTCPGIPTVTDHEGNVYNTVQIGPQCWTRENMRCFTSPTTGTNFITDSLTLQVSNMYYSPLFTYSGKMAYSPYSEGTDEFFQNGVVYNWNAAVDTFNTAFGELGENTGDNSAVDVVFDYPRRGICPDGWHVPSRGDWEQLVGWLQSHSEYWCDNDSNNVTKSIVSKNGWGASSENCAAGSHPETNNVTGFSARKTEGSGFGACFWSTTQYDYNNYTAIDFIIGGGQTLQDAFDYSFWGTKGSYCPVRCVKD